MRGIIIEETSNELYSNNEKYLSLDEKQKREFNHFFNILHKYNEEKHEKDLNELIEICYNLIVNINVQIISEKEYIEEQMKERASCIMLDHQLIAPNIEDFNNDFECLNKKTNFYKDNNMFSKRDKKKKYFKNLK